MNKREQRMLEILKAGRDHGMVAVKAEFEAEGTRTDELLRLLDVARRAGLKVGLKIGGCEAIRDLIDCRQYGADYIIAPMVETPYALKKYIEAKDKVFPAEEQGDVSFLFNVETITAYRHLPDLAVAAQAGRVGMVLGRVDFAGSLGRTRDFVNSEEMIGYAEEIAREARDRKLELVMGGGVNPDSILPMRRVRKLRLDRFETRKVIFDAGVLDADSGFVGSAGAARGMELAIDFELLWLKNKRDFYGAIAREDEARIAMMDARQKTSVAAAA